MVWCLQSMLEKKKTKSSLKFGQNRGGGMIITQKQGTLVTRKVFQKKQINWYSDVLLQLTLRQISEARPTDTSTDQSASSISASR